MNKNLLVDKEFLGCAKDFGSADIIVFGAPFDGTVTFRPGTRFAPSQMRIESPGIETYSPYLNLDLDEDASVCDMGDLDLPFGTKEKALDAIKMITTDILKANKKPFMIGGEHLVTLPAVKAVFEKYPDLCLLHFDAHTDLREDYLGEPLSHSTVLRRIWDFLGDGRIWQFGIRSGTKEEFKWSEDGHTNMEKFTLATIPTAVEELRNRPVYVTIDLDVLDPSIFPGTGTPEAGGVNFKELLDAVFALQKLDIVGADIVELSPHYDKSGVSTAVACKIMRELLLVMTKS